MTYTPDPHLVRIIAQRILITEIDTIRDLGTVDIMEMCEDEVTAVGAAAAGRGEDHETAEDSLINAVRDDIKAALITFSWAAGAGTATLDAASNTGTQEGA